MTLGALADPTKWAALPPILVKPWNTLTSDFDPWIHFMFPLDGLHTLHMDWMSHHSCTEDVQVAPPTHTHARKDQAPHLGIGPTYHEGGGVDGPPICSVGAQVYPSPSSSQHAKMHKCEGSPPFILWWVDPKHEVKITWIHWPTSITIYK
jgi:hypothetical protein